MAVPTHVIIYALHWIEVGSENFIDCWLGPLLPIENGSRTTDFWIISGLIVNFIYYGLRIFFTIKWSSQWNKWMSVI